ncbi:hypothetical protein [Methylobacterium sp. J-068]|uniref:hypothetical protein n=1 Tax=Methylobacterium sp. J-068 TaxID=2836649 RepID=UPI001FB88255|nr:hypothetical protein [Methylobacterium sp. J-068]MCJ2036216.1 hypothetical protein [Methylobacterium sp. J-068]
MRYTFAAALMLCATGAFAGPMDFLGGIPDAPGVVHGGSFGPSGNDYYGDMRLSGPRPKVLGPRYARMKPRHPSVDKRAPRS